MSSDVEMEDAEETFNEVKEEVNEGEDSANAEDAPIPTIEAGDGSKAEKTASTLTSEEFGAMQEVLDAVYAHREEDGHDPSKVFHRKVNKRALPTYYDVIKEPIALSTIKARINFKEYKYFSEFVRDFALISHNAQVYNRPQAGAYKDALTLKALVEAELRKLVDAGMITEATANPPFLGEIPPQDEGMNEDGEEDEEEDEEEEEEEEAEESDDSRTVKPRGRGRPKGSTKAKREAMLAEAAAQGIDIDSKKKRARPPRVDTPMEARIKNILKSIRRFKNSSGQLKIAHFDRLPDRALMPEYFNEIRIPMALDVVKKKVKRKKYQSIDQFMRDMEQIFENAKMYNQDESQIYKDAVDLQLETRKLAELERQKPDSDFVMEDGRLPMPNGILHNGELYKVGDWVHIQNPNDLTKPIPSQIYRTWQDSEGRKWINACWYYRPEQTVHRFDRHFFENEIVKTGQYRDHQIDEIVDRCFVMFVTRYNKGRPRGFPADKEIYVCEARYNEEKHKLNKIKTWASCLPDEVRDKDYEMDLFEAPKKMKKIPSPIAYLLKDDAKETDDLPKPEWGADNAPPKIGAVHKRPRDPKDSPPPEPTPTPPPQPPPPPPRQPSVAHAPPTPTFIKDHPIERHATALSPATATPTLDATQQAIASLKAQQQAQRSVYQGALTPAPAPRHIPDNRGMGYSAHTPQMGFTPNNAQYSNTGHYGPAPPQQRYAAPMPPATPATNYKAPPPTEVWHLGESANSQIPAEIRNQFQCDNQGRVLFFTSPPLEIQTPQKPGAALGHSARYLAKKAAHDERVAGKRAFDQAKLAEAAERRRKSTKIEQAQLEGELIDATQKALVTLETQMVDATRSEYQSAYAVDWYQRLQRDLDVWARSQ